MTDQQLKKMNRRELLELMLAVCRERDELQSELERTKNALKTKRLQVEQAGSIAEASIQINGVFEAAQAAAEQYLENIREMEENTRKKCQMMEERAKQESDAYWQEASARLEDFCKQYAWLNELISFGDKK